MKTSLPYLDDKTLEKFWANVDKDSTPDCWMWTGPTTDGHPQAHLRRYEPRRIRVRAYIVAWEIEHGPFTGQFLLSECGDEMCIRPLHRSPATVGDLPHNSDEARARAFWDKVADPDENGCREWTGAIHRYGSTMWRGEAIGVHRLAWRLTNGPIPEGMFVCHKCDNPPCCNVDHLFLGQPRDNSADMVQKGRSYRAFGTAHAGAKLTVDQVLDIRTRYHRDRVAAQRLAPEYGVTTMTIWHAAVGDTYKDVPMPESVR